jgi:hypothetical protein
MDRITEGFLNEFSNEFGVTGLPEKDRFELFCGWLSVRRHYSESTFDPSELVTGSGGDTGFDALAIIVNNNLVTDVDTVEDLLSLNGYLDVTFVFVQASRSPHFEGAKNRYARVRRQRLLWRGQATAQRSREGLC